MFETVANCVGVAVIISVAVSAAIGGGTLSVWIFNEWRKYKGQ